MLEFSARNNCLAKEDLPHSLRRLVVAIESELEMSSKLSSDYLRHAKLRKRDLAKWTDFDYPADRRYGKRIVYDGGFFEIAVLSWRPGDFSSIHAHNINSWGAFQIFGSAEYVKFLVQGDEISTVSCDTIRSGQVVADGGQLIHQISNQSDENIMTFHVYGTHGDNNALSPDIQVYNLEDNEIQTTDNHSSFELSDDEISHREIGSRPDYLTWLRHKTQIVKKSHELDGLGDENYNSPDDRQLLTDSLLDASQWKRFRRDLLAHVNLQTGHAKNDGYFHLLCEGLKATAALEKEILPVIEEEDPFLTYAELYDDVIGRPCLDEFMTKYLEFAFHEFHIDPATTRLLSLGCGTGLVEAHMLEVLGINRDNLLGVDLSEPMVRVAQRKIRAEVQSVLELEALGHEWDIVFSGLNVFQYLAPEYLKDAISNAANAIAPGGYFIGDFITPDHIRYYPNVLQSQTDEVISLRCPLLVEKDNKTFQQSEIINVSRKTGKMIITNEGKHLRYLPSLSRMRDYFESAFHGKIKFYDAMTLQLLDEDDETCPSTRYLVIAQN